MKKKSLRPQPSLWPVILLFAIFVGLVCTIIATSQSTELRKQAASCNDAGCANIRNGSYWMITNCDVPTDPDGDQQLCNSAKRIGICRAHTYCCPNSGAQWTSNMTACPTSTPIPTATPSPTHTPMPTNTPIPTTTPQPTNTSTPTPTRAPNATATPTIYHASVTPTRKAIATPTTHIIQYNTPTPNLTITPTPFSYILDSCDKACASDTDCPGGLVCISVNATTNGCRNTYCTGSASCLCDTGIPGYSELPFSTDTTPLNPIGGKQLSLTVSSSIDSNGNTGPRPSFAGRTEPGAKVTISILPDGMSGNVVADENGFWSWSSMKNLSGGKKDLLVVATKDDGQGQTERTFTVIAPVKGNSGVLLVVVLFLVAAGIGGFFYIRSQQT